MNATGPSPLFWRLRSRSQTPQRSATARKPSNRRPLPQRGQRHPSPALKGGDGVVSDPGHSAARDGAFSFRPTSRRC